MSEGQNPIQDEGKITIQQYLEKIAKFSGSEFGKLVRDQFQDIDGACELAMLACPSGEELEQLRRAVAIMTSAEKANVEKLSDRQIQNIAEDAKCDPANFAIFINGYCLQLKKKG